MKSDNFIILMMSLYTLVIVGFVGCDQQMPNDQIISETKKCESAGMEAQILISGLNNRVISVQCVQKRKSKYTADIQSCLDSGGIVFYTWDNQLKRCEEKTSSREDKK